MKIYPKKRNAKKPMAKNAKDADQDKRISRLNNKLTKYASANKEVGLVETIAPFATPLQGSPAIYCLNKMAKGSGLSERTGDTAYMTYLEMRCQIRCNNANFLESQAIRVIIVREKTTLTQNIGLDSYLDSASPYTWYLQNKKDIDPKRYKTYYDRTFDASGQSPFTRNFSINKRLGFKTNYSRGNLGTVADIDTNGLFLILITDCPALADTPIFSFNAYVHFNK